MTTALSRLAVTALCIGLGQAALADDEPMNADFDGNGVVDLADAEMLRDHVGQTDPVYDLDGSGRVDVRDLFLLADVAIRVAARPAQILDGVVRWTRDELVLRLAEYTVHLHHGEPFGISSLRLHGQAVDFAHKISPLADWEWLWYRYPTARQQHKLIEVDWPVPSVTRTADRIDVDYRFPVTRHGVEARVRFSFPLTGRSFQATYEIFNGSMRPLVDPYVMIGLPGFPNQDHATAVSSAREQRYVRWPARTFLAEALERDLPEYLLLKHIARTGVSEGLKGTVTVHDGSSAYTLSSYYLTDPDLQWAYSAHTNKPRYLTSHLYATLPDLPPQASRSVTIHHVMTGPK